MLTASTITRKSTKTRFAAALTLAIFTGLSSMPRSAQACPQCKSPFKPGTYTGEAKRVGNGVAYSWVTLDADGKPYAIGVTLTESALEGLSEKEAQSFQEMERDMYLLILPKEAGKTAFDHISLDWAAKGHPPLGVYDKPHFDIHFYMMNLAQREKITALGADVAVCRKTVPTGFTPAGYIYAPGTEGPMMGGHWISPTKFPELNGKEFTSSFIYGSYNGQVTFFEPMVTKAFLDSKAEFSQDIPLPTRYAKSAYYPTRYTIHHDPVRHECTIALEGMIWRVAAPGVPAKPSIVAAAPVVKSTPVIVKRK